MTILHQILAGIGEPFWHLVMPEKRIFWPFLAGALALALGAYGWRRGFAGGVGPCVRTLFPARIWLHPSSYLDVKLLFAKAALRAVWVAPWALSALGLAQWVTGALDRVRGVPERPGLGPTTVVVLYTLVLFFAWDFSRYFLHRLAHRVPLLWELHKVHHSAEVMTPLTLYRSHPIETFLFELRGVLVTGLVTGVFFHGFRGHAVQAEILGVNAVGFVFNLLGGNLRHSHVWISYGGILEHVLISPAQHQIHHGAKREHYDRNFGSWLAIWDWMGGSLAIAGRRRPAGLRFGLDAADRNHHPYALGSALAHPILELGRVLRRRVV
jgi:sterol desaturase/sphingolipid hydroxylase (fatty acid hydroxylase superfamily)